MSVSVIIKWGGQEFSINSLSEEDTVMDLKQSIKTLTGVLPERQKLLGLKIKGEKELRFLYKIRMQNFAILFE